MTDPVAAAMQPLMDTLYARWLEEDTDAGLVDPDMFYERRRDREAYEQRRRTGDGAYERDLADMGLEPHEYEERER